LLSLQLKNLVEFDHEYSICIGIKPGRIPLRFPLSKPDITGVFLAKGEAFFYQGGIFIDDRQQIIDLTGYACQKPANGRLLS
jgi:hypothetical protein